MANNWSLELPEPTGEKDTDNLELYSWAVQANEMLKKIFGNISIECADIQERLGGAGL